VLRHLGYPPVLPWFDTYDRLWRFILSSPLAGAWMFMPAATNHENRSRDKQRRKVGDFQDWLVEHFPDQLTPPAPRRTPAEAREWVRQRFPGVDLDRELRRQEATWQRAKAVTRLLGMGAVEEMLGRGHPPEVMGAIVHGMQAFLPPKAEREAAMADPQRWADQIRLARAAAVAVGAAMGFTAQTPEAVAEFIPLPEGIQAPRV
jgi:hypothetical protein